MAIGSIRTESRFRRSTTRGGWSRSTSPGRILRNEALFPCFGVTMKRITTGFTARSNRGNSLALAERGSLPRSSRCSWIGLWHERKRLPRMASVANEVRYRVRQFPHRPVRRRQIATDTAALQVTCRPTSSATPMSGESLRTPIPTWGLLAFVMICLLASRLVPAGHPPYFGVKLKRCIAREHDADE